MPFSLIDHQLPRLNVKIDLDSMDTPEKSIETLNHLQDEINRLNDAFLRLLQESLGLKAYDDGSYGPESGAADVYVVTMDPAPIAYADGMHIEFNADNANTGAATVNVNGLGAKSLKLGVSTNPGADYIKAGSIVVAVYDGTNFQMTQPAAQ